MLTQERADLLSNYLSTHLEETEVLLTLEPEEALAKINAAGIDYSIEELKEYCDVLKTSLPKDELDGTDLDNVTGGVVATTCAIGWMIACGAGGALAGIAVHAKW